MANAVTNNGRVVGGGNDGGGGMRPARLPRWTPEELRVLIRGKNVAENRARWKAAGRSQHVAPWTAEPKWAVVSSYCRRHGVDRSPRQCRKRWDNLARDYKRIKVWECRRSAGGGEESFWAMRNERRRERRLPGYFDRVVYELLDGAPGAEREEEEEEPGKMGGAAPLPLAAAEREEGALFDSGRAVAEDGLFSDYEGDEEEEGEEEEGEEEAEEEEEEEEREPPPPPPTLAAPISERKPQPHDLGPSESGMGSEEQPAKSTEKGSSSREAHKRKRPSSEDFRGHDLQDQIMEILERNSRTLAAHLEAQNIHWQLERDQRKDHTDRLVGVLSKLADALGRIADKLSLNGDANI